MQNLEDLSAFLDSCWQHLGRGVADSRSPARYPTFATVSAEGKPEARTVALRAAHRSSHSVEVHTDIATAKVRALAATPFAALHIWLPKADLQIRLTTTVTLLQGNAVEAAWQKVPAASRVSYGTQPDPGLPIESAFDYEKPPLRERFVVLHCAIDHIDLVHLGAKHRRAAFMRSDDWAGQWLAP